MCIPETPSLGVRWCPGCEPERDPSTEILETTWCTEHVPNHRGSDDRGEGMWLSGSAEAGSDETGHNQQRMCELIHRPEMVDEGGEA